MKLKLVALLAIIMISTTLAAQTRNTIITDQKLQKGVMIGYCDKQGLKKGAYGSYFNSQYELYEPVNGLVKKISEKIQNVEVKIVFGSWCHDSKVQLPRFIKILDQAGYDERDLTIIGVDSKKSALVMNIEDLKIERVPTFILSQNGVELGRIIESPKKTLEKDLWKIVRKAK